MLQDEVVLMIIVIALYLYDAVLLLFYNEGVLIPRGEESWSVRFGSGNVRIRGREIFIPNLLLPHRPQFRLSWSLEGSLSEADVGWTDYKNAFRPIGSLVWGMALALFVAIPMGLFTRLAGPMLLAGVLLLYSCIIAALLWLWFHRTELHISGKRFGTLAFEALICSPMALNLVRTVSGEMHINEDLVTAARRLQAPGDWKATCEILVARLDEEIEGEECDSERMAALQERRRKLVTHEELCQPPKSL